MKYLLFLDREGELCGVFADGDVKPIVNGAQVGLSPERWFVLTEKPDATAYVLWNVQASFVDLVDTVDGSSSRGLRRLSDISPIEWRISLRLNCTMAAVPDLLRAEGHVAGRTMTAMRASTSAILPDIIVALESIGIAVRLAYQVDRDHFVIETAPESIFIACDDYAVMRVVMASAARCVIGVDSVETIWSYGWTRDVSGESALTSSNDADVAMLIQVLRDHVGGHVEGVTATPEGVLLGKRAAIHDSVSRVVAIVEPYVSDRHYRKA